MTRTLEVRPGAYRDSVSLMQVSSAVSAEPGVRAALVAMATELNLDLLVSMGFDRPDAGPGDLVIGLSAEDDEALARAGARLEAALAERARPGGAAAAGVPAARTLGSAVRRSDAGLALVSTPGSAAFLDAVDALEAGASVMVFSDNVPVEQEVVLKDVAAQRGLLVMGPDCGTAVVAGVGLGFANAVRPGPVGVVAASGTGAQQLLCLLDAAGVGVTHCLGVGGRDLSAQVAGRSALQALRLLDEDPSVETVVVVSKPPADEVAERVREVAAAMSTPVVLGLLGRGQPDLTAVARRAVEASGGTWSDPGSWAQDRAGRSATPGGRLRGLFSGGTLCDEAMVLASEALGPVRSNIPLRPEDALSGDLAADGAHATIDFGDDRLTSGRPHPMIDMTLRVARIAAEAEDPTCGVLLLDVVLGYGAHPDPAAELAPALAAARATAARAGRDLAVVVSLCGTASDPQGLDRQAQALHEAGASVHRSNAAAAREAVALVEGAA